MKDDQKLSNEILESTPTTLQTTSKPKIKWWYFGLIVILAILSLIIWRLTKRPDIKIGETSFYQHNSVINDRLSKDLNQIELEFKDEKTNFKLKLADLEATINQSEIKSELKAKQAFRWDRLWTDVYYIPVKIDFNKTKAEKILAEKLVSKNSTKVEPTIVYDVKTKQFVSYPGKDGLMLDLKNIFANRQVSIVNKNIYQLKYLKSKPKITQQTAENTKNKVNNLLKLRYDLNYQGRLLYFADPWDIAAWLEIKPNLDEGDFDVIVKEEAINKFLKSVVEPAIKRSPVDQRNLVDKDGKTVAVLQYGRKGFKTLHPENLAKNIKEAVELGKGLKQNLNLVEADFKTVNVETDQTGKWIDINLTKQTATLYIGTQALQTFVISSGLMLPTPTGEFYVWHKTAKQNMRGDGYDIPNVHWNTFFTKSGVGFHEAYWHQNFGHPMSHGCINMRKADAKVVYDFAPIGTKVISHY